jgi:DNA-binding GntR family transcriptional regulator
MSHGSPTFDRVYAVLKREILSGRFKPGSLLPLRSLAGEFGTSVSPVRDAMARLVGERILEVHIGGGFQRPILREKELRDLYSWHTHLMRLVLRDRRREWIMPGLSPMFDALEPLNAQAIADATTILFCRIAECSDNIEHVEAVRTANDRLHATRVAEACVPDRVEELRAVAAATASGSHSAAQAAIWSYQRRRLRRIGDIVAAAGGAIIDIASASEIRRSRLRRY